jgi:hypothetical protein
MTDFAVEAFQNENLPPGGTNVDAIVTVTCGGERMQMADTSRRADGETAVVIVIDNSGSMKMPRSKLRGARRAAGAALAALRDGTSFAVLAGSGEVVPVYPPSGLASASPETRAEARTALRALTAGGGTAMSRWLDAARDLLSPYEGAIRQVILLTDGRNEGEHERELEGAVRRAIGVFQCDCRGVGTDWSVAELRTISSALSGSIGIVPDPDEMAADFETIVRRTMSRHVADVRLRISMSPGTQVGFVKQTAPTIEDLTGRAVRVDDRTFDHPTGAWGSEERDYHVRLTVQPRGVGDELLAARVAIVVDDEVLATSLLRARWTDDPGTSTVLNERVAHATGQEELASAIAEGLAARNAGDVATATDRLGRAVQLAQSSRHDETMRLLRGVVEVEDAASGTVRLRPRVALVDDMSLDVGSTKTVRLGRGP